MRPLLELASEGQEHSLGEARERLAASFKLTDEEKAALLPSGRQSIFANRVAWAKVYLGQAGALDTPRRGYFRITDRGRELLKNVPDRITIKDLARYPEFLEFRSPKLGKAIRHRSSKQRSVRLQTNYWNMPIKDFEPISFL